MDMAVHSWRKYAAANIALALALEDFHVQENLILGDLLLTAYKSTPHTLQPSARFIVHIQEPGEAPSPNLAGQPGCPLYRARVSADLTRLDVSQDLLDKLPLLATYCKLPLAAI